MAQKTSQKTKRQRVRRAEYLKEGLCIACGQPVVTSRHCEYHRKQHNANSIKRQRRRRKEK